MAATWVACATAKPVEERVALAPLPVVEPPSDPPDAPPPPTTRGVLLRGGTVLTATGERFAPGFVLLRDGKIAALGPGELDVETAADTDVIDVTGRVVTPGLIDTHSHIGVYALPSVWAHWDGNEGTRPVTAEVWAEHSFWPQDPAIWRALSGGVTTIQVLPGSANLIGGRSFTAKLRPATSARQMRFPGAPQGLKMACGENPKGVYGRNKGTYPSTRMGNVAAYRKAFQEALEYKRRWERYERDLEAYVARRARGDRKPGDKADDPPEPPNRDHSLESLKGVLEGKLLVHNHCYRADEMSVMLDLAKQYGFQIRSFHHALEAYKLRHRLAAEGVSVSTWSDWWGFKMEALDGVPQNVALLHDAGVRAIVHSDSSTEIRHLNQEAAKARAAGAKVGLVVSDDEVLRWLTANPAWALGIDEKVGTLEVGKMADVVVWSGDPFSVYTRADLVLIDGVVVYDRENDVVPIGDFEVGLEGGEVAR